MSKSDRMLDGRNVIAAALLSNLLLCFGVQGQLKPETSLAFSQSSDSPRTDLANSAESDDRVGWALAAGDFDGDGHLDLVIGVPFEDRDSSTDSGWVHVVYGTGGGLSAHDDQTWDQSGTIEGLIGAGDQSGYSVTTADFNDDGYDDIAFGSPGEDIGSILSAGAINVIYGSPSGLVTAGNRQFHQDTPGIIGGSEPDDQFGSSLAAGDFNDDGFDEIVIGVPREDIGSVSNAGAIQILLGTADGVAEAGNVFLDRNASGMGGVAEDDFF